MVFYRCVVTIAAALVCLPGAVLADPTPQTSGQEPEAQARIKETFTGDLPQIIERRLLRVLISYSRTNYFIDFGTERGFEYELLRKYEEHLNQGRKLSQRVIVVFIPVPLEKLLSDLEAGRGDIAAGGLTVSEHRRRRVDFSTPYIPSVHEVVVSRSGGATIAEVDDLSGREVWVRRGSTYENSLRALNSRLEAAGKKPVKIVDAPPHLGTEDLLELLNAGVFDFTVADQHIAEAWAGALPKIRVHPDLGVSTGGSIAWAIRKKSPALKADLDAFVKSIRKGTLTGNIFFNRYFKASKWISNPLSKADQKRLEQLRHLFQKYGEIYGFDWLALAAVGYQESGLDQSQRSRAGAVGVMQLKPSTAADKNVNVTPIDTIENNIHAGTKYLAFLRDRYFSDPEIPDGARFDFTLAAYNTGPARVASLRREAAEKGYDRNLWFGNVETVAAARVGSETLKYVANINKYYLAYTDFYRENLQRELQKQSLSSPPR